MKYLIKLLAIIFTIIKMILMFIIYSVYVLWNFSTNWEKFIKWYTHSSITHIGQRYVYYKEDKTIEDTFKRIAKIK